MNHFFESVGGVKTLILLALIALIALYLRRLSKKTAADAPPTVPTADELRALPVGEALPTVIRCLLADCEAAGDDPYRRLALWPNPCVNVYTVWAVVKESESGADALAASPTAAFLPLAADGFDQIGAPKCAVAAREQDSAALLAAVAEEQPLTLCDDYIRDNADAFRLGDNT